MPQSVPDRGIALVR